VTFSIFSAALNHQIMIYGKLFFYSGNKVIAADLSAFDDCLIYNYFHGILRKHVKLVLILTVQTGFIEDRRHGRINLDSILDDAREKVNGESCGDKSEARTVPRDFRSSRHFARPTRVS
jgi:hypothetical protein